MFTGKRFSYFFGLLVLAFNANAKILIITHCYNRSEFIEMQYRSFKALILDDHEYIVFNDAPNKSMNEEIHRACNVLGIRCFDIPQSLHKPSDAPNDRHAAGVNFSLDRIGFDNDDIVCIIDSDMFLVRPLSIREYMKNKHIVSAIKGTDPNIDYLWPVLMFLNMPLLPDRHSMRFNPIRENGISADSGGQSHYYLKAHRDLTVEDINILWSYNLFLGNIDVNLPVDTTTPDHIKIQKYESLGFNKHEIAFMLKRPNTFEFFFDKHFVHYHGGSNYHGHSALFHMQKMKIFNELLDDAIASFEQSKIS